MGKKQYQVISPWEDKGRKPLYPKSDRIKHIVQSARVIRRSMEINLSENDTNLLYDTSHRCRSERVQPLMGSKQVNTFIRVINFKSIRKFKYLKLPFLRAPSGMVESRDFSEVTDEFLDLKDPIESCKAI